MTYLLTTKGNAKEKDTAMDLQPWIMPADYIPPTTYKSFDGRVLIDTFLYLAMDARCPTCDIGADSKNEWMTRFIAKAKELASGRQLNSWNDMSDFDYDMCEEFATMFFTDNEIGQVEILSYEDVF